MRLMLASVQRRNVARRRWQCNCSRDPRVCNRSVSYFQETTMRVLVRTLAMALMMLVLAGGAATLNAQPLPTVMAQGLDNPRGLAFGPDGMIYVVEAGRGGTSTLCLPNPTGPLPRCYGATGAVT